MDLFTEMRKLLIYFLQPNNTEVCNPSNVSNIIAVVLAFNTNIKLIQRIECLSILIYFVIYLITKKTTDFHQEIK